MLGRCAASRLGKRLNSAVQAPNALPVRGSISAFGADSVGFVRESQAVVTVDNTAALAQTPTTMPSPLNQVSLLDPAVHFCNTLIPLPALIIEGNSCLVCLRRSVGRMMTFGCNNLALIQEANLEVLVEAETTCRQEPEGGQVANSFLGSRP